MKPMPEAVETQSSVSFENQSSIQYRHATHSAEDQQPGKRRGF
jgi:hypothetical protein